MQHTKGTFNLDLLPCRLNQSQTALSGAALAKAFSQPTTWESDFAKYKHSVTSSIVPLVAEAISYRTIHLLAAKHRKYFGSWTDGHLVAEQRNLFLSRMAVAGQPLSQATTKNNAVPSVEGAHMEQQNQ